MDFKVFIISVLFGALCLLETEVSGAIGNSGWNSAPDTNYHIQTDEGSERYFRYQTTSGQYRKEKRLEDGTVIGTSGWVDPNGMLRLNDYIADNKGYRILRSKMIFVGNSEDIGKGVSKAKYVPAQSGTLVTGTEVIKTPTVLKTVESSTVQPFYNPSPIASVTPISALGAINSIGYPSSTPIYPASTYGLPSSTPSYPSSTPSYPSSTSSYPSSTPAYPSSTPGYPSSTPLHVSKIDTSYKYPAPDNSLNAIGVVYSHQKASVPEKTYNQYANNNYAASQNRPSYSVSVEQPQNYETPYRQPYRAPTRSYDTFGQKMNNYQNNYDHPTQNDYNSNYGQNSFSPRVPAGFGLPTYDGISTTKDGFRYYLPRQYHEEVSSPSGDTRTGSFGYIDPFGIRRVTYYNTNPGSGFIHRKNNRYVGFNATPYDPRF